MDVRYQIVYVGEDKALPVPNHVTVPAQIMSRGLIPYETTSMHVLAEATGIRQALHLPTLCHLPSHSCRQQEPVRLRTPSPATPCTAGTRPPAA